MLHHGLSFLLFRISRASRKPGGSSKHSFGSSKASSSYGSGSFSGSLGGGSGKRDYRGDHVDYKPDSPPHSSESNQDVEQKLSALSKALTDATALLKSAGLPTGKLEILEFFQRFVGNCALLGRVFSLPVLQKVSIYDRIARIRDIRLRRTATSRFRRYSRLCRKPHSTRKPECGKLSVWKLA